MEKFFTVHVKDSGIGDQLGQLSRFYALGMLFNFTYIHTPFVCPRSSNYNYSRFKRFLLKLLPFSDNASHIVKFIGLDKHDLNINDEKFRDYKIVDIYPDKLLEENNISHISQLRECIEMSISPPSDRLIYSFVWGKKKPLISKLNYLDGSPNFNKVDNKYIQKFGFSEKYWKARELWPVDLPFNESKIKIAVHIRKGDIACINIGSKIINDRYRNRNRMSISQTNIILEKIFDRYGKDNFSVIVISDGYESTFRCIRYSIRQGQLKLNRDELRELGKIERVCKEEFKVFAKHSNVSTIIGETEENLFKSIHTLACADIIIKSSASCLPNHVQQKFSKPNHSSILIEPWQWDEQTIESMEQIVQEKLLCLSMSRTTSASSVC